MPNRQLLYATAQPGQRGFWWLVMVPALLICGGCVSVEYTDRQQVRHIVGFVDIAIKPPASATASGVSATTLGLALYADGQQKGMSLGYNKNTFLSLANGACLNFNEFGPCVADPRKNRQKKGGK